MAYKHVGEVYYIIVNNETNETIYDNEDDILTFHNEYDAIEYLEEFDKCDEYHIESWIDY